MRSAVSKRRCSGRMSKAHDARAVPEALSGGDHRPIIDGVGVHLGERHLAPRRQGPGCTRGRRRSHRRRPPPRAGRTGSPRPAPHRGPPPRPPSTVSTRWKYMSKNARISSRLSPSSRRFSRAEVPKVSSGLIYVQIALLLRGAAAGEGGGRLPGVAQQSRAQQQDPHRGQHGQGREHAQGAGACGPAAAASRPVFLARSICALPNGGRHRRVGGGNLLHQRPGLRQAALPQGGHPGG